MITMTGENLINVCDASNRNNNLEACASDIDEIDGHLLVHVI